MGLQPAEAQSQSVQHNRCVPIQTIKLSEHPQPARSHFSRLALNTVNEVTAAVPPAAAEDADNNAMTPVLAVIPRTLLVTTWLQRIIHSAPHPVPKKGTDGRRPLPLPHVHPDSQPEHAELWWF